MSKQLPNEIYLRKHKSDRERLEFKVMDRMFGAYWTRISELSDEELKTLDRLVCKIHTEDCLKF